MNLSPLFMVRGCLLSFPYRWSELGVAVRSEFRASSGVRSSSPWASFSVKLLATIDTCGGILVLPASLRLRRCGFWRQHEMMALTAIKMAKTPVRADCTAIKITPVIVLVVCAIPSSSTKTRIHTTDRTRTSWMKILIMLPDFRS